MVWKLNLVQLGENESKYKGPVLSKTCTDHTEENLLFYPTGNQDTSFKKKKQLISQDTNDHVRGYLNQETDNLKFYLKEFFKNLDKFPNHAQLTITLISHLLKRMVLLI